MRKLHECEYRHLKHESEIWKQNFYDLLEIIVNCPDDKLIATKKLLIKMDKIWKEWEENGKI